MKSSSALFTIVSTFILCMTACHSTTATDSQSKEILANLSPNMRGIAENVEVESAGVIVVNSTNELLYMDDWRRALLLDKPSVLSPYPVIDH